MAEAIGKRITRVVEICTIETGSPRPMMGEMTMMRTTSAAAAPTPVEPGELHRAGRVLVRAEFQ